jgi:hypothetical protein
MIAKTAFSIQPISKLRFDALAGYVRRLGAYVVGEELAWYEHPSARVLGTLIRDVADDDFGGIIMGPDGNGVFRCVDITPFSASPQIALGRLTFDMERWSKRPVSDFEQGDERAHDRLNVFLPLVEAHKLNPAFVQLAMREQFSPARALIEAMIPYYTDVDGNFIEQFQSTAFDARFWELYLFALLAEERFVLDRHHNAPDFMCEGLFQDIFVEAVTVGPSRSGNVVIEPMPPEGPSIKEYLSEYMPIKWAGALTAKLQKRYWALPHVTIKPVVFAIQDFHVPRAMTFTTSTLLPYLYGRSFAAFYDAGGNLYVKSARRGEHIWGNKTVESGFFYLPGAQFISAVLHNPTATISKFNRMARLAGLGSKEVRMFCFGTAYDHKRDASLPASFRFDVDDPSYTETWSEGLNVYHNPTAVFPLHPALFPSAMHHRLSGEQVVHTVPRFHPYSSTTLMVVPRRIEH